MNKNKSQHSETNLQHNSQLTDLLNIVGLLYPANGKRSWNNYKAICEEILNEGKEPIGEKFVGLELRID